MKSYYKIKFLIVSQRSSFLGLLNRVYRRRLIEFQREPVGANNVVDNKLRVVKKNDFCHSQLKKPFQTQIPHQEYIRFSEIKGQYFTSGMNGKSIVRCLRAHRFFVTILETCHKNISIQYPIISLVIIWNWFYTCIFCFAVSKFCSIAIVTRRWTLKCYNRKN